MISNYMIKEIERWCRNRYHLIEHAQTQTDPTELHALYAYGKELTTKVKSLPNEENIENLHNLNELVEQILLGKEPRIQIASLIDSNIFH